MKPSPYHTSCRRQPTEGWMPASGEPLSEPDRGVLGASIPVMVHNIFEIYIGDLHVGAVHDRHVQSHRAPSRSPLSTAPPAQILRA